MVPELFEFNQLSPEQQVVARASVIAVEHMALKSSLKLAKSDYRHNLHAVINSAHHIPRIVSRLVSLKRLRGDITYLDAVIRENQCRFSHEGAMYLFMKEKFVSAETLLADQSKPSCPEVN
ncbi:hypothetical protein ABWC92_004600 [Escherichia coli]